MPDLNPILSGEGCKRQSHTPSYFLLPTSSIPSNNKVPSVKVELTDREMDAAVEFARQCGESVPDLMRKLMIRDATLADGFGADDPSYNFSVILPIDGNAKTDREQIENGYNQIRKMLGWREIHL